ncbi:MAG: hypothetical protein IPI44_23445 [Sulfuritalea sp.]|nr:hypothetical protein [Sulfuritalea sp.]
MIFRVPLWRAALESPDVAFLAGTLCADRVNLAQLGRPDSIPRPAPPAKNISTAADMVDCNSLRFDFISLPFIDKLSGSCSPFAASA